MERGIYKLTGIDPEADMRWTVYVRSILAFSLVAVLFVYLIERTQHWLFWSVGMANVPTDTAWNTAVSFTTNTNWQNYAGEATMGYLTQQSALMVQQFMSAAVGLAVAIAMIRGFTRSRTDRLGNFWVDVTRGMLRLLIPLAVIGCLVLVASGAIENLANYHTITTLSGAHQTIPGGTVASQESIKDLGNNGGGWFNANAAHPFESPNPFTNIFIVFMLLLIPFATPRAFGKMVGDNRQGYALVAVMVIIWACRGRRDQLLRDPPGHRRSRAAARARRAGGRGGTDRHARLLGVRGVDHGDLDRLGELFPRLADAVRRRHRAVGHRAGRDRAGRDRGRHVRHPGPGHGHGVRGRADGRPDAGVHREEDPARRDEVRGAVLPDLAGGDPDHGGDLDRLQTGARPPSSIPGRTG